MTWDQVVILLCGVGGILLANLGNRWAPILGLIGQVGWFHQSYTHHEWGAFVASVFYTGAWCVGLHKYWRKR